MTAAMRFALVDPENCPMCQRVAQQVEISMRLVNMSEESIEIARSLARCEGHRSEE